MSQPGIREGLTLLRERDFAKLFGAYLVSYFGTAMAPIALAFGVLELTGSTREAALVIAASTTALVLTLLVGGTIADRSSRQRLLVTADGVAACSQLLTAFLFLSGHASIPLLAGLMFITGTTRGLHSPSTTGFITQVVARDRLQAANALLGAARSSSVTVGAALAGILVATLGPGLTLAVNGVTFGLSGLLIWSLQPSPQQPTQQASLLQDLRLGWREFTSHQWLWSIVLQFSLLVAALDATFALLGPAVARTELGGAVDWGIISSGMGFGTLAGGLIALKLNVKRPMLVCTIATLFFALQPLALAVPLSVWLITAAAFIGGVAGEIFSVLWYTTLQKLIPSHLLSRVSAYDHLGSVGLAPLGIIVGGYLFETIGSHATLLIAAATVILPGLCVLGVRDVRQLTTESVNSRYAQRLRDDPQI